MQSKLKGFGLFLLFGVTQSIAAQTLTPSVWYPYTDRDGLIHSVKVGSDRGPSTNNGLLYTAEACVIMQLNNVAYDRKQLSDAVKSAQVKPGLYRRSKEDVNDFEAIDDYVGLGALAGVCGFHDVAREILNYGNGEEQPSRAAILALGISDFTYIHDKIQECKSIPYNYNNVDPGSFSTATWMGKFPAVITHWKLGAGDRPTSDEFAVWSAALLFSAMQNASGQDHWLQSWLMVLTYEMSEYHSTVADFAVAQWWRMFHERYPGGVKQTMTEYLSGAPGNPLAEYIDDFEQARNPSATVVDNNLDATNILDSVEGLMGMSCGQPPDAVSCITFSGFSPTAFLSPLTSAVAAADDSVRVAKVALSTEQQELVAQNAMIDSASKLVANLSDAVTNLQAGRDNIQQQAQNLALQKADMIAKALDKIPLPVSCTIPKVLGVPVGPPICVPGGFKNSPNFDSVVNSIAALDKQVNAAQDQLNDAQRRLGDAQNDLVAHNVAVIALKNGIDQLQKDLTKGQATLELAKGALEFPTAIVQNLIPCSN
jgi:cation transport regulator ChaB